MNSAKPACPLSGQPLELVDGYWTCPGCGWRCADGELCPTDAAEE